MRKADTFIDKRQNAAILKLSPLFRGLREDISCQKNSQELQITHSFDGVILKCRSCTWTSLTSHVFPVLIDLPLSYTLFCSGHLFFLKDIFQSNCIAFIWLYKTSEQCIAKDIRMFLFRHLLELLLIYYELTTNSHHLYYCSFISVLPYKIRKWHLGLTELKVSSEGIWILLKPVEIFHSYGWNHHQYRWA